MNMPLLFQVHVVVVFHRNGLFHAYNSPILAVRKGNVLIRVDINDCLKIVWDRTPLKPENRSGREIKSASPHCLVIFNLGFVLEVIKNFTQK